MGYGIMPYRINLKTLENQYGTDDESLKQEIINSCQSQFERLDNNFKKEHGWENAKSIMTDFLNGTLHNAEGNTAKKWYVIKILIGGFGQLMDNGSWYPADISPMYSYSGFFLSDISESGKFSLNYPDDFPVTFTIQKKNFESALADVKKDYTSSQISEFESWINEARDNDQDIVLYYY